MYNYKSLRDLQFQSLYITKSYINCIANRLNSLYVLYSNLEKKVNDSSIKGELEIVKKELKSIKNETDSSIKEELEIVKKELKSIKNETDSLINETEYKRNINLDSPNYLEYTTLFADFENNGVCIYCPSEPYEPNDDISFGPVIDNDIYTNLKNILNN